jgi:uncharacterized protein
MKSKRGLVSVAALATATMVAVSGAPATATSAPPPPAPDGRTIPVPTSTDTAQSGEFKAPTTTAASPALNASSAWYLVKYNRIYKSGKIGASQCREPRYPLNSAGNIKAWHISFVYCLNKAWYWKLRAARVTFVKPTLVVHTSGINDPYCGFVPANNEYYCGGSKRIYVPWVMIRNFYYKYGAYYARSYALHTIAHEYGHHVQQLTGILPAVKYRQRYVLKTTEARLQENRRMELQASCFSGMYVGANRNYYPVRGELLRWYQWMIKNMGDENRPNGPRDHGSKSSHNFWTTRGWYYQTAYACMTWSASASVVD